MTQDATSIFWPGPRMGFGSASITAVNADQASADELVRAAWESGIRYFDTAPMYAGGVAEERLGAALRGVPRDGYQLSSKVGRVIDPERPQGPHDHPEWRFDFSRDGVLRSIEDSLRRLGTDRLDICYIHDPDHFLEQAVDQTWPTLLELREQGVVGALGTGVIHADLLATLIERLDLDVALLAEQYSLIDDAAPQQVLDVAERTGVTVVIAGALHGGLVDGTVPPHFHYAPVPDELRARVQRILAICREFDVPLGAAALGYVLADPRVGKLLTGPADVAQFEQNLAWSTWPVPDALWRRLDEEGLLHQRFVLGEGR